jgi:hypothetical protein
MNPVSPSQGVNADELLQELLIGSLGQTGHPARETPRNNCSVAILLCPLNEESFAVDHCVPAITVDLSEAGMGVITRHPLDCHSIGIAVQRPADKHSDPPDYALATGRVRHNTSIGGGFWHVGVQLLGLLAADSRLGNEQQLRKMASHILPPSNY